MNLQKWPIQKLVYQDIFNGQNVLFCSETGSGKTLAYLLPLVERIQKEAWKTSIESPSVCILTPNPILQQQVLSALTLFKVNSSMYPISPSIPKRLLQVPMIGVGYKPIKPKLDLTRAIVFDEVDELLKCKSIQKVYKEAQKRDIQLIACGATADVTKLKFPGKIYLTQTDVPDHIEQEYMVVQDKVKALASLLKDDTIVFVNDSKTASLLHDLFPRSTLFKKEHQKEILEKYTFKGNPPLITTDVLGRGVDVDIERVINFDIPPNTTTYIHRAGRAGRHSQKGHVITLVLEKEVEKIAHFKLSTRLQQVESH